MDYSLKFLKNYRGFHRLNEAAFIQPKKVKFDDVHKCLAELEQKSPDAIEYLNNIIAEYDNEPNAENIIIQMQRKAQTGLTKEQMQEKENEFKNDNKDLTPGHFIVLYYESVPFTTVIEKDPELKKKAAEFETKVKEWNTKNGTIFKFDNNVSDKVNNPDESNKALTELKTILDSYKDIIANLGATFEGHTSTPGETAFNQKLSEGRAATVKNMFSAIMPDSANWNITSTGKGESEPIVKDDKTEEDQQKNRRVQFVINTQTKESTTEEKTTYNIVAYVIIIGKKPSFTGQVPKKKKTAKILDIKKRIPCPHV